MTRTDATGSIPGLRARDLAGRHVVIWGAGRHGGGLAAARWCHRAGARVSLLDRRPPRELPEVMAEAGRHGWPWHLGQGRHPVVRDADLVVASPAISPAAIAALGPGAAPITCPEALFLAEHAAPRIAVTGSKGKSTTAAALATLLDWPVGGNSHQPLLDVLSAHGRSCPVVCELSSFQLWHLRESAPRFDAAIITSLHRDHIDWHGDLEHYRESKLRVLDWADAHAMPDDLAAELRPEDERIPPVRLVGDELQTADGRRIGERRQIALPGDHNVANVGLAIATALHLGLDPAIVGIRLEQIRPLPHRLEVVHAATGLAFIDDSIATTPEATIAGLATVTGPVAVILGGADKGADYASLAAAVRERGAHAVCIGETGPAISGLLQAQGVDVRRAVDLEQAVIIAGEALGPAGGTVLLSPACASTDMFEDFHQRGTRFASAVQGRWPSDPQRHVAISAQYADLG